MPFVFIHFSLYNFHLSKYIVIKFSICFCNEQGGGERKGVCARGCKNVQIKGQHCKKGSRKFIFHLITMVDQIDDNKVPGKCAKKRDVYFFIKNKYNFCFKALLN